MARALIPSARDVRDDAVGYSSLIRRTQARAFRRKSPRHNPRRRWLRRATLPPSCRRTGEFRAVEGSVPRTRDRSFATLPRRQQTDRGLALPGAASRAAPRREEFGRGGGLHGPP